MAQCVAIATDANGLQVIVPDDTCAQALVLVDSTTYATLASNPLMLSLSDASYVIVGACTLFLAAWSIRMAIKALMH
ncbi:MAG: hypothetical protein P4L96_03865 [Rhodoferax sp.]|nr:hypothetical protein [Rhodoferax sp.]